MSLPRSTRIPCVSLSPSYHTPLRGRSLRQFDFLHNQPQSKSKSYSLQSPCPILTDVLRGPQLASIPSRERGQEQPRSHVVASPRQRLRLSARTLHLRPAVAGPKQPPRDQHHDQRDQRSHRQAVVQPPGIGTEELVDQCPHESI
jgi:hypothetical protein